MTSAAQPLGPITFVASAPGKLILAGEHSVVHFTRALAAVIDKRTFAEFRWTPAKATDDDADLAVELTIDTDTLKDSFRWTYAQLREHAAQFTAAAGGTPLSHTLATLQAQLDAFVKSDATQSRPTLASVPNATNATGQLKPTPAVFLLFYFGLLRPASSTAARGSLAVTVRTQLPIGAGLGSSASFASALACGFVWLARLQTTTVGTHEGDYLGTEAEFVRSPTAYTLPGASTPGPDTVQPSASLKQAINWWAYEGERVLHGNPSGLDNTTCVYGGVIEYRKANPQGEPGFMRPLTGIPSLHFIVVDTRQSRVTAELVANVGRLKTADEAGMRARFDEIEGIVTGWLQALGKNDASTAATAAESASAVATPSVDDREARVGALMRRNQALLREMGVSHARIETVLEAAEKRAFPGKLTGAGGGGCVIVLKPTGSSENEATAFAADLGPTFECLETVVGQAGVWIREHATLDATPELAKPATAAV